MDETYLVAGGAGFIGSHLVDALLAQGKRVRVLGNFSTGRRENLSRVSNDVELIEATFGAMSAYTRLSSGVT